MNADTMIAAPPASAMPTVPVTSGTQSKPAIAAILSPATATPSR